MWMKNVWAACVIMLVSTALCQQDIVDSSGSNQNKTTESEGLMEVYIEALGRLNEEIKEEKQNGNLDPSDPQSSLADRVKNLRDKLINSDSGITDAFLKTYVEGGGDEDVSNAKRAKRGIGYGGRWTYGIIPYVLTEVIDKGRANEIRRAQLAWGRFTCMRFVPWIKYDNGTTTSDLLGLDHQGHINHIQTGGCWAIVGNIRSSGGQSVSCCGGTACLHELGHAMGLNHEQSSPDPNRLWLLRLNRQNMESDAAWGSYAPNSPAGDFAMVGYDYSTHMHYAAWMFAKDGKPTFTRLFPEANVRDGKDHYMMMMVSLAHKCEQLNCSHVTMKCENDGYMTLVDGRCQCKCVDGLDHDTGCTSVINSKTSTQGWPGGSYALPHQTEDCADPTAKTGQVIHTNDGKEIDEKFCVTENSINADYWPAGVYCIQRKGGQCPEDFEEGFIELSSKQDSPAPHSGSLPDGVFEKKTRFEYCCRDNGFTWVPVFLPNTKPYSLVRNGGTCQEIRGMHVKQESTTLIDEEASVGGAHPFSADGNKYTKTICSYAPTTKDCGSYHELSKQNPTVHFSSPKGDMLDCYWFVKAPPGEHIRLSFDKFSVDGTPGKCKDTLGIQYFRAGHKLYTFCGDRMDRTFQSINNTITVHLRTIAGSPGSEFSATATLTLDEDLCYNAGDRGTTYRGSVSFTRWFEPCLPWNEVQHCPYHPFKYSESGDNTILEGNFCRNPDYATGIKPWCYTNKENCERNYCDVCLYGERYDRDENCAKRKENGLCTSERFKEIAYSDCAKTCNVAVPAAPPKAKEITCGAPPDTVTDGKLACGSSAGPFSVGSKVTYKCDYSEVTKERVCLTSGEWSPLNYVCDYCPNGWKVHLATGQCYGYFHKHDEKRTLQDALRVCGAYGGEMVYPKDANETEFIAAMLVTDTLIAVTDREVEGVFTNSKGEKISYTNWKTGQPDDWYDEDCVSMLTNGYWNDRDCEDKLPFMCVKPMVGLAVCADHSGRCQEMLKANASMCLGDENFSARTCPFTCGDCEVHPDPKCTVDAAPANAKVLTDKTQLSRGQVARYACNEGFVEVSGDAIRGCAGDSSLTGTPLKCVKDCPEGWTYQRSTVSCYQLNSNPTVYETAFDNCREIGASLALTLTQEVNTIINKLSNAKIWLGLDDKKEEGSFVWADGEPLIGWTYWSSGNPDNWADAEHCVMMSTSGQWNDVYCTNKYPYVCQFPLQAPTCAVESAPANAKRLTDAERVRQGAIVKYSCNEGFVPKSGLTERECKADGSFTGSALQCVKARCPIGWSTTSSVYTCYRYFPENVNRESAIAKCQEFGATLAMPKRKVEMDALLNARKPSEVDTWIYLDDTAEESEFRWGDGELLTWSQWSGSNPNDWGGDEDCVQVKYATGDWNDVPCGSYYQYHYVCQMPMPECPKGPPVPTGSSGLCYEYNDEEIKYNEAEEKCNKIGAKLAMPKTKEETDKLQEASKPNSESMWIGLDAQEEKTKFVWVDGQTPESTGWTNWAPSQPDNWANIEDCANMRSNGQWNDVPCDYAYRYACQYPIDAPMCRVEAPAATVKLITSVAEVREGATVDYACVDDLVIESGDASRRCQADGSLSGKPLSCFKDACPTGWMYVHTTNMCYGYFPETRKHNEAIDMCKQFKGTLAMPKNKEQLDAILQARKGNSVSLWLNVDDIKDEGVFMWGDGNPLSSWNKWHGAEPNNWGNMEDCVVTTSSGLWNDIPCGERYNYVCQASLKDVADMDTSGDKKDATVCRDNNESCGQWKSDGWCGDWTHWMQVNCAKACGVCDDCDDKRNDCVAWAGEGWCDTVKTKDCPLSCGDCDPKQVTET